MSEEGQISEILSGQARIETHITNLNKKMDQVCNFKDGALAKFQEFDDYKAGRDNIQGDLVALRAKTAQLRSDFINLKKQTDDNTTEVDNIKTWLNKASGIQLVVSAILILITVLSPFVVWYLGAR